MKKFRLFIVLAIAFTVFSSHDMFLKFSNYFLKPNTETVLQLFNGTFEKSDNSIDRNRMLDASLAGNGKRISIDTSQWFVKDSITYLKFKTGESGTWVSGVSTKARNFEMTAKKFNDYLKNDGIIDILEDRKATNTLDEDAVEKYSKHVKTIFQVGTHLSDDWNVNLGYPIEFIPLKNPYEIHSGHKLPVKLLRGGKPLANHWVYVGHKPNETKVHSHDDKKNINTHHHGDETHSHDHNNEHNHSSENVHSHGKDVSPQTHSHNTTPGESHEHESVAQLKTDANGIVTITINDEGIWYLRTIHMLKLNDEKLTHESNWATLTFAIGSGLGHSHDDVTTHEHENEHKHEDFPSYLFWIGSIILVGILFFFFNGKK